MKKFENEFVYEVTFFTNKTAVTCYKTSFSLIIISGLGFSALRS